MKVYVAGHTGLVGSAVTKALKAAGHEAWSPASRLDLRDRKSAGYAMKWAQDAGATAVVLAAAHVGGIGANASEPVAFLVDNLRISTNVISLADEFGFDRLVNLGSSCIYPRDALQPICEESLLTGPLEPTNEWYAVAKIAALKMVQAYRRKGRHYISLMPTNLYGDNDRYDPERGHVIPSMIVKFERARKAGTDLILWGSGQAMREFLHVDDLARAVVLTLEKYDDDLWLNVGSGEEVTIGELAHLVASAVGFTGQIGWDRKRPDGTPRKALDSSRIRALGWEPMITLRDGLARSVAYYREHEA